MSGSRHDADADAVFLLEAARYFERRPTGGEDRAHWSNVYNAENCRRIAARLSGGAA
jgi:hypothetical protein